MDRKGSLGCPFHFSGVEILPGLQSGNSLFQARRIVRELFALFLAEPDTLPSPWRERAAATGKDMTRKARVVCDYIAGMTDRYAIDEHRRLFNLDRWV